ncbi:MAG: KilA-N domain protein [Tenericutes bacterium ADurb.BinA155]|nr:MAG: KilA-N domain protein [Tenericutes bacterium ADurb.BinA155]
MSPEIVVLNKSIAITGITDNDFLSLTDLAKAVFPEKEASDMIGNWLSSSKTIDFIGLFEELHNPNFKLVEFHHFKNRMTNSRVKYRPQNWIKSVHAIGIRVKSGRYGGGTWAHRDIAFEFASWLSPTFKLYLITEFQRLKAISESASEQAGLWLMSKLNYLLQTEAIKKKIAPISLSEADRRRVYANEADVLNLALFGITASQYQLSHDGKSPRESATLIELVILSNLELANSYFISLSLAQSDRLLILNQMANEEKATWNENNRLALGKKS